LLKNIWLVRQYREELYANAFLRHKKVKEIINIFKRTSISKITKNNKTLTYSEEICRIWEQYIQELFNDICSEPPSNISSNVLPIMESEMVYAFSALKIGKAPGEDNIHAKVFKLVNIRRLCQLFNAICDSGNIPVDLLICTFVVIRKKY